MLFQYHSSLIQWWQCWLICSNCLFLRNCFRPYHRFYFSPCCNSSFSHCCWFFHPSDSCDSGVTKVNSYKISKGNYGAGKNSTMVRAVSLFALFFRQDNWVKFFIPLSTLCLTILDLLNLEVTKTLALTTHKDFNSALYGEMKLTEVPLFFSLS